MSILINKKFFLTTFFLLILAEIFSYLSWQNSLINTICFSAIVLATLILSWRKLEYGLYILFAELFVGSFGYLFSLPVFGFKISIRMGLFMTVMGVWLYRYLTQLITRLNVHHSCHSRESENPIANSVSNIQKIPTGVYPVLRYGAGMTKNEGFIFCIVIVWAFVWGLIRGNGFSNVFFDFNNWLYFLVALPILSVLKSYNHPGSSTLPEGLATPPSKGGDSKDKFLTNIFSILSATVLFISLKTLVLFYLFTHGFVDIGSDIYRFVRDTRIGEITLLGGGLVRIFMQSQVYALMYLLILFCNSQRSLDSRFRGNDKKFAFITYYLLLITSLATIILSLSRSFWFGLVVALFAYFIFLIFKLPITSYRLPITFLKSFAKFILIVIISLGLIISILYLPPKKNYEFSVLIAKRGISNSEPASSSRMNQLKPLLLAIVKHPIIGSGFGTTVTYKSDDPRVTSKDNLVNTYAFEWGYLDMILKFGLVGLGIYLYFIYLLIKSLANFKFLISNFKINSNIKNQNFKSINHDSSLVIHISFFFALVALIIVNIFSPYLNHPLGIGFIILIFILCNKK